MALTIKKISILTLSCLAFIFSISIYAEQDPIYTQYQFNTLSVNPAYAGSRNVMSMMLLSRHQWVGFEGAPSTQTFTAHTPLNRNRIGVGLSIIRDEFQPVSRSGFYADYSYRLNLTDNTSLRLGLKAGLQHILINYSKLDESIIAADQAYPTENFNSLKPNFGFGIYIDNTKYYLGASVPRILEMNLVDSEAPEGTTSKYVRHYFLMAGGIFNLSSNLKFKPSFITRLSHSTPLSADFNLSTLYKEKLWTGIMYRLNSAYGAVVQFQITPQLKVGYAYEIATGVLQKYNNGTHEILVNFELNFRKGQVFNPRYF